MEVKKYNPFVVIKPTGSYREQSSKPNPRVNPKAKGASPLVAQPKPQTKLEAGGLALENKKKLVIIYAKGFVKTSRQ